MQHIKLALEHIGKVEAELDNFHRHFSVKTDTLDYTHQQLS